MKNLLWGLFAFATLAHAQGTVTDIDGNTYDYLTFGTQQWTVENAAMETYRDGTPIPQVTNGTQWENLTTGAWCYYDNDPTKGKLYNWYAVAGIHNEASLTDASLRKEITPEGWYIPTPTDFETLSDFLISQGYIFDNGTTVYSSAKSVASTTGWDISENNEAVGNDQSLNNSSGLNIPPTGQRGSTGLGFYGEGQNAQLWTSLENAQFDYGYYKQLFYDNSTWCCVTPGVYSYKYFGKSLRMIKNSTTASLNDLNSSKLNIFPNPVGDTFEINADHIETLSIYNILGEKVFQSKNQRIIDVSSLASGTYILKLSNDQTTTQLRFIKK